MGGRSINDPFCGHSCYDDVMGLEPTLIEELLDILDGMMDLEGRLVWLGVHVDHGCV